MTEGREDWWGDDIEGASLFFEGQARQTKPLRRFLYRKAGLRKRKAVLDAGCGTGEITAEITGLIRGKVTGIDTNEEFLNYASSRYRDIELMNADCNQMPFDDASFDLVTCHFLFMWLRDPAVAASEMVRILEPGGVLLSCAELDYGGAIDFPEHREFTESLGQALLLRGADPHVGRKMGALFRGAGLGTQTGVSTTPREGKALADEFESLHEIFRRDLELVLGEERAERILKDESAQRSKGKMSMVPLFWAFGFKN